MGMRFVGAVSEKEDPDNKFHTVVKIVVATSLPELQARPDSARRYLFKKKTFFQLFFYFFFLCATKIVGFFFQTSVRFW